jgi:hypothetical protein
VIGRRRHDQAHRERDEQEGNQAEDLLSVVQALESLVEDGDELKAHVVESQCPRRRGSAPIAGMPPPPSGSSCRDDGILSPWECLPAIGMQVRRNWRMVRPA